MIMTFEIHDAFKIGDEVKNKEHGIIGIVVAIEEYNVLYPYKVKNQDGSVTIHSRNGIVMYKESADHQSFKLYDKVEVVDKEDINFGQKGIVGYVGIQEGKETYYRIQNESKDTLWLAMESQIKLVSDEQEEEPTLEESQLREEIERLKRVREVALKANLELQEEVKQLKQEKEDFKIEIKYTNSEKLSTMSVTVKKEDFNKEVTDIIKQGYTIKAFWKMQELKTTQTYIINE